MARRIPVIALFMVLSSVAMGCRHWHEKHDERWAHRHHVPYQASAESCSCSYGGSEIIPALPEPIPMPMPKKMPPAGLTSFAPPEQMPR